jgi:hypothetical protein
MGAPNEMVPIEIGAMEWLDRVRALEGQLFDANNKLKEARRRLGAWKALARSFRKQLRFFGSNPGYLLAMLVMESRASESLLGQTAAECLAWVFEGMLRNNSEAKNYIEFSLATMDGRAVHVTIQRPNGKTPSQLLNEAKLQLRQVYVAMGMHQCAAPDCETWMSSGAPRYCSDDNDLNP